MNRIALPLAAVAALWCNADCVAAHSLPPTPPTTVPPLFYSEIVAKADCIVTCTVVSSESRYENGRATIRTYVQLGNLTFHKGDPRSSLTLRFDGGRIGDDHLQVPGMPQLQVGHRYFLYIDGTAHPEKVSPIVGFYQGAFEIVDRDGREVLVNMEGQELVGVQADRFVFRKVDAPKSRDEQEPVAPTIGEENHAVKWAEPNADALEARIVAQQLLEAQRQRQDGRLTELPAGQSSGPASATPPSTAPVFVDAPVIEERDRTLAIPVVVDASGDPGTRAGVAALIQLARTAQEGGNR
ncbi:MAG: hypothetical protein IPM29_05780 [Planctomycetes bacterium]|nr:hypothetical protein [Planctomycetota bacterium]